MESSELLSGPVRTCIGCRKKNEASQMLRFVRHNDGEIVYDKLKSEKGRGANICNQRRCLDFAVERKAFARAFKQEILFDKKSLESAVF